MISLTGRKLSGVVLLAAVLAAAPCGAQMGAGKGGYALEEGERNLKFAGIPIPSYSEVLGANLGVVAMAYYKMDRNDPDLPPSLSGLFGFYSANNSWIGAAFQRFHLDGDRWRLTAALGTGSVKYQFNPSAVGPGFPDIFVDYTTATGFLFAQGLRRTWGDLYLGLAAVTWSARVAVEPDLVEFDDERYTGPGLVAEWDRRDHIMQSSPGACYTRPVSAMFPSAPSPSSAVGAICAATPTGAIALTNCWSSRGNIAGISGKGGEPSPSPAWPGWPTICRG